AAREAARRMSCSNNLKQLGLGVQNYNDVFLKYPFGTMPPGVGSAELTREGWGWGAAILPFIEQGSLFEALGVNQDSFYGQLVGPNKPAVVSLTRTPLKAFRCASDSGFTQPGNVHVDRDYSTGSGAAASGLFTSGSSYLPGTSNYIGVSGH